MLSYSITTGALESTGLLSSCSIYYIVSITQHHHTNNNSYIFIFQPRINFKTQVHAHEIESGRTSTVSHHVIGFRTDGEIANYDQGCRQPSIDSITQVSESKSEVECKFRGVFLYTIVVLCYFEWCIRLQALMFFYHILYNITSTAHNHHTDLPSFKHVNTHTSIYLLPMNSEFSQIDDIYRPSRT